MTKSRDLGNSNVMTLFLKLLKGVIVLIYYFHTYKILLKSLFSEAKWDLAIIFLGQTKYLSPHIERAFLVTEAAFKKFSYSTLEYFVPHKEMYLYYSCRPVNCFLGNSIQPNGSW